MKQRKQTQDREDYRSGLLAAILCNVNRAKGESPKQPADFFPNLKPPRRRQTTAEALAIMRTLLPPAPRKEE